MGLDRGWRILLKELFPNCFFGVFPMKDLKGIAIIDDWTLNNFRIFNMVKTWKDITNRSIGRVKGGNEFMKDLMTHYVVLFDEKKHVTRAKNPIQSERKYAKPLSEEERLNFVVGVTDGLDEKTKKDEKEKEEGEIEEEEEKEDEIHGDDVKSKGGYTLFNRIWATRELQSQVIGYMCNALCSLEFRGNIQNKCIIIDGGRIERIIANDSEMLISKKYVEPMIQSKKYLDPFEEGFEIVIEIPNETQKQLGKQKEDGTNYKKTTIFPSNGIGESDLKITYWISKLIDIGEILVLSCDGDTVACILLHMKDWIDKKSGQIKNKIWVDFSSAQSQKSEYVEMTSLWRQIIEYYEIYFPNVTNPIETFVLLMIMTKSDYTEPYKQISQKRFWEYFYNGGHMILYPIIDDSEDSSSVQNDPMDLDLSSFGIEQYGSNMNSSITKNIQEKEERKFKGAIICSKEYGNPDYRQSIAFVESRIFDFLEYIWFHLIMKPNIKKNQGVKYTPEMRRFEYLKIQADMLDQKQTNKRLHFNIPSKEEIYAKIRRTLWTIDYYTNDGKKRRKDQNQNDVIRAMNPLEKDLKTGLSIFGWEEFNGIVLRSKIVKMF